MRDDLLSYYERELTFLRQMGAEFAQKYPKIAARLVLEPDRVEDPHVERLVEAFAFLAARVHLKIDDEFPEITDALLNIVYPHYLRPIPSMSVVEFHLDPEQGKLSTGLVIPRHAMLYSRPFEGAPCKFRVCYETTIWPVRVAAVEWRTPDRFDPPLRAPGSAAALRIQLDCLPDISFEQLDLSKLRFYLNGESNLVHTLYELLLNNCSAILLRDPSPGSRVAPLWLPAEALRPIGFGEDEDVLPYPRRSFVGYRLLQEYFSFPEKFLFAELSGLERLALAGFSTKAEIIFLITPFERADRQQLLEVGVTSQTVRLNCSPVVNLFPQTAEPILVDQTKFEHPVVPDVRRRHLLEIYSIDEVISTRRDSQEVIRYEPFYSYRHGGARNGSKMFWHARRQPSTRPNDEGTEVFLTLVDLDGRPACPPTETVTVRCTCTNRDLPHRLPFGSESGDFELEGMPAVRRIVALKKPTPTMRPPSGKGAFWRLISHLSLNYLSLVEEGREALQEILRLYDFTGSPFLEKQVRGITRVASRRHFAPVRSEHGIVFARGRRVEIELDEEQFVGGGVYLFASVLERFLGLYASMNSFSQLVARTRQRKELLKEWPPRAGDQALI